MKKAFFILTGAVLLFAGCAKVQNEEVVSENGKHRVILKATVENPGTRVSADIDLINEEATFSWQTGDRVSILASDGSYASGDVWDDNPGTIAEIEVWLDDGLTLGRYAYYPYAYRDESIDSEEFVLGEDWFSYKQDETFMPMLGDITPSGAVFRAVGGVLKVHFTNIPPDAHFLEFFVEGKKISGVFPITVVNGKKQITTTDSEDGNSIMIAFWDSHEEEYDTDFYIPLPCGTYYNLTFKLYEWEQSDEYALFSRTALIPGGLEVQRNDIIITPEISVEIEKNTPSRIEFEEPYGYTLDEQGVIHMDQFDTPIDMVARIYGNIESKPVEDVDEDLISCTLLNVTDPDNVVEDNIYFDYDVYSGVNMTFPTDVDGEFKLKVYYDKDGDNPLSAESCTFKVYKAAPLPEALKTWKASNENFWFSKYRVFDDSGNAYLKTYAAGTLYGTNLGLYPVMPNNAGTQGPFDGAFSYNSTSGSFDAFQFFEKVTQVPNYAFSNCGNMTGIILPNGVTSIGNYAFNLCRNLVNVTLSADLETIGQFAFRECENLTSIVIPGKVKYIKKGAFLSSGLTSITIPASVVTIEPSDGGDSNGAFCWCRSSYVIMEGTNPPDIGGAATDSDWYPVFNEDVTIYVPDTAVDTYQTAWPALASRIKGVSELTANN